MPEKQTKERLDLMRELEAKRGSRVVCYITGDREPDLGTRIGMDVFPFFYEVLARLGGKQPRIDILLYGTGGATMAAWGLVNLFREFCENLNVLIPFKAHSTATLIALGANEIVMTRTGQLSPVDPTITSPFNPVVPNQAPGAAPEFLPVSVEDVNGFMELVRKEAGSAAENHMIDVIKLLANDVRPLALGSVYRAKEQIRMLARKLLSFHMGEKQSEKIEAIVAALTRELYSHDYVISRREAKDFLNLQVSDCPDHLESLIMDLFLKYSDAMELYTAYSPEVALGTQTTRTVSFDRAFIESTDKAYVFRTRREVKRVRITREGLPIDVFQQRTLEEGWTVLR